MLTWCTTPGDCGPGTPVLLVVWSWIDAFPDGISLAGEKKGIEIDGVYGESEIESVRERRIGGEISLLLN